MRRYSSEAVKADVRRRLSLPHRQGVARSSERHGNCGFGPSCSAATSEDMSVLPTSNGWMAQGTQGLQRPPIPSRPVGSIRGADLRRSRGADPRAASFAEAAGAASPQVCGEEVEEASERGLGSS